MMDADIEMVNSSRDEVGPAADLNISAITPTERRLYRQNRCFASGMLSFLIVMMFFISSLYQKEESIETAEIEQPGDRIGELPEGLDNKAVAEGAAQLFPHQHKIDEWKARHNKTAAASPSITIDETTAPVADTPSPVVAATGSPSVAPVEATTAIDPNVQQWLDAEVTLRDGAKFEIVSQLNHDKKSFTEGLTYANGVLYESVGMKKHSAILVLNATTGDTLERHDMDASFFGEGLTYVNGKLIQLTYRKNTGFVYNAANLSDTPQTFTYQTTTGEGWGLTHDPVNNELIVSDGSEFLHFWDPDSFEEKRKVAVTLLDQKVANNINELEYWNGRVLANVWFKDTVLVINPQTGMVEKEYDFTELWDGTERLEAKANVLNGISVAEDSELLYFTGKYWDRMFLVRLLY